ncbi:MAG: hypothetical protein V1681_04905 [Candidatus Neomarinimicrobiota bacterium]
MDAWISYLTAHPIVGAAILAALILFVIMVLIRLIKWAILSFIILALAVGFTYKVAQPKKIVRQIQQGIESVTKAKPDKVSKEIQKNVEKTVEKVKDSLKDK